MEYQSNPTMPPRYPPELAIALQMKKRDPAEVEDILSFRPDLVYLVEPFNVPSFVARETEVRTAKSLT